MMFDNMTSEQRISITAITVSVFLHAVLFVQLVNTNMGSQVQAPDYSTRISLNMLPPLKQLLQLVKAETPVAQPEHKTKPKSKPVLQPKPVAISEQVVAPRVAQDIQRGQVNDNAPVKKHYLNNLLTYIEGHKYYPQAARSRGIKGSIEVSFELLNNGDIKGLKTIGGSLILRKAAEQAVSSSLPLPLPPAEVNCPLQVSYAMQFQLN